MRQKITYEKAVAALKQYLQEHNMRHTPERYHVLQYCCDVPAPFSMEQIIACAQKDFISRNTVYNTVNMLLKAKILHTLNKQFDSARKPLFEFTQSDHIHTEFICTRCGRMSEFKPQAIESVIMNRRYTNFVPEHFTLYVYGQCKACRRLINKKEN